MTETLSALFKKDITRDIPPVVYFQQDGPQDLLNEVSEYIITGGVQPNPTRTDEGIHDQYVRLLTAIGAQLKQQRDTGRFEMEPGVWISGFFGSGKSSFAKLLGLALDGRHLPDGRPLADALLAQDLTPQERETQAFAKAWDALVRDIHPLAVVFDIGHCAKSGEPVHQVVLRELARRLNYAQDETVARHELALEKDGEFARFEAAVQATLGAPWDEVRTRRGLPPLFSKVMTALHPEVYAHPMDWIRGHLARDLARSPGEAVEDIRDMLHHRGHADSVLFIVIDEVSQYLYENNERMLQLQSFVSGLKSGLPGRTWLLVTGQEKLDDANALRTNLAKMKDRFPARFRVHLSSTNIRDVLHQRLLRKSDPGRTFLRAAYARHGKDLALHAFGGADLTEDEFVDTFPLLPGYIELLMEITTALRRRSTRAQGDDQTIRGLLQLLGELFRGGMADGDPLALVSLDRIFEVLRTALDSDTQQSLARLKARLDKLSPLHTRVVHVVALLQLIGETYPVTADLIAQCLYDQVGRGPLLPTVEAALTDLVSQNLLGLREQRGYYVLSSAAEEWAKERDALPIGREKRAPLVAEAVEKLVDAPSLPSFRGHKFPWLVYFSDAQSQQDVRVRRTTDAACVQLDLRYLPVEEGQRTDWLALSDSTQLRDRILWVSKGYGRADELAGELGRSKVMLEKYAHQVNAMSEPRRDQYRAEQGRVDDLQKRFNAAVAEVFVDGALYFRGEPLDASTLGKSFTAIAEAVGERCLPQLFLEFEDLKVTDKELEQLLPVTLGGIAEKFFEGGLGLFVTEHGKKVATCPGRIPQQIRAYVAEQVAVSGDSLIKHFGGPPYGYHASVIKACAAGLLRGGHLRATTREGVTITATRDSGANELFTGDRAFRGADWAPPDGGGISPGDRGRMVKLFRTHFRQEVERDDSSLADAADVHFRAAIDRLVILEARFARLPAGARGAPPVPAALTDLRESLEAVLRAIRRTQDAVRLLNKHLKALDEGLARLKRLETELTDAAVEALTAAAVVRDHHLAQLDERGALTHEDDVHADALRAHLDRDEPWIDAADVTPHADALKVRYRAAREALLTAQGEAAEAARAQVKGRQGFERLDGDDTNFVLRPIANAPDTTTLDAVAPTLTALDGAFLHRLAEALELANERLDERLAEPAPPIGLPIGEGDDDDDTPPPPPPKRVVKVAVSGSLVGQEIETEAQLDRALDRLRKTIQAKLTDGVRVRLT